MRTAGVVLAVVASFAAVSSCVAAMMPYVSFSSNDLRTSIEIPFRLDSDGKYRVDNWEYSTEEYSVQVSALLDPDPSIAYAIGVTDLGAPSGFSFIFGTPIVAVGSPNAVSGSIVGGLTDFTGDGVSLTPLFSKVQASEVGFPLTSTGVDVGDAVTAGAGSPGALYTYGAFSSGSISGPGPGPWTWLQMSSSFMLSGGSDSAALTGFTSIDPGPPRPPVPEPTSLALVAGGLLSMAIMGAKRRRAGKRSSPRVA